MAYQSKYMSIFLCFTANASNIDLTSMISIDTHNETGPVIKTSHIDLGLDCVSMTSSAISGR